MKKLFCLLAALLLPFTALAVSQDEWNRECRSKTTGTATLYGMDISSDGLYTPQAIGTVPDGTYIKPRTYSEETRMWEIAWMENGVQRVGWIERVHVADATQYVYFTNGTSLPLPEALANDRDALEEYLGRLWPDLSVYGDGTKPVSIDGTAPEETPDGRQPAETAPPQAGDEYEAGSVSSVSSDAWLDWALSCRMKTADATPVYRRPDMQEQMYTIPADTYVKIQTSVNGLAAISFMTKDGVKGSGYTLRSGIVSAVIPYYDEDGILTDIHELLWDGSLPTREEQAGGEHPTMIPEKNDGAVSTEKTGKTDATKAQAGQSAEESASSLNTKGTGDAVLAGGVSVELVSLGMSTSTVRTGGREETIGTDELTFGTNTDPSKRIAVIWAPYSGRCTLRNGASDQARSMGKCKAGTVVAVLDYGREYTKILFKGDVGYVQTRCLQFHAGDAQALGYGMLTYNGRGSGKTTVNIRCDADGDSAKIAEWKTGTVVTVLSHQDGWYEIEHRGQRGYVMEKYLTMQE